MLSKVITLFTILLLLIACTPVQAAPTAQPVQLVIPTRPLTAVTDNPLLPILLPNEANQWITYRDSLTNFGLALPQQWRITPTSPAAASPHLTLANFDTSLIDTNCAWPEGLVQVAFSGWQTAAEQPTLDWIGTQFTTVQSLAAAANGRYAGYLLTTDQQQTLILRLTPSLIVQIQVTPQPAWQLADVQGILNSLAAPNEAIDTPAVSPTDPQAIPTFCREAATLYAGAGEHFAPVGLLLAHDSLPIIGHSHDGRWLKLLYPNTPDHTAWASLQDTIATSGKPPIEAIQVRPGNG
ncbi:MAG: hypothetical protein H6658_01225 [Ardenticatenaceae bacterium]|nr:hypothetical protein [Ardenticatenaceae bacterium]